MGPRLICKGSCNRGTCTTSHPNAESSSMVSRWASSACSAWLNVGDEDLSYSYSGKAGLVLINASSSASRSAGVYLERSDEVRDSLRDRGAREDCRDTLSGAGACRLFILLDLEMDSGVTVPKPGSGGRGLLRFALSAKEAKLFVPLMQRCGWSKTPAAAGDMTENANLILRCSAALSKSESDVKLDMEEVGL